MTRRALAWSVVGLTVLAALDAAVARLLWMVTA